MPLVGFEPTISAGEGPQTYALDRAATGTGTDHDSSYNNCQNCISYRSYLSLIQMSQSDISRSGTGLL